MTTATPTVPVHASRERTAPSDDATQEYLETRRRLLALARRIVGTRAEAEDVVQDAWIRWHSYDRAAVANPTAFLVTTTARLAINVATSARARHETHLDATLPEPAGWASDAAPRVERRDALERGLRVLLERLAPTERAAYVLRQAFDYPYARIAEMLGTSEANARQIVSRAGRRLSSENRRPVRLEEVKGLLRCFLGAATQGAMAPLEQALLSASPTAPAAKIAERTAGGSACHGDGRPLVPSTSTTTGGQ
jgi:RNA polymerase sigma-70 factor (ECF subfamily)